MNRALKVNAAIAILAASLSLYGQTPTSPRVTIKSMEDRDLVRLFRRTGLAIERLRLARQVLHEATGLLGELLDGDNGPRHLAQVDSIVGNWLVLDRRAAPENLEEILLILRHQAKSSPTFAEYRQWTTAALKIASILSQLVPARALHLIEGWPRPTGDQGQEGTEFYKEIQAKLGEESFRTRFETDPPGAISTLFSISSGRQTWLNLERLQRTGDPEKVNRFIDEELARVRVDSNPSQRMGLLQSLAYAVSQKQPERLIEIFDLMLELERRSSDGAQSQGVQVYLMGNDETRVEMTRQEMMRLQMLRQISTRPNLLLSILDRMPDMKNKLEALGGIDEGFNARRVGYRRGKKEVIYDPQENNRNSQELIERLRFKAFSKPGWVKQQLQAVSREPSGYQIIQNLVSSALHQYPELAEIALDVMEPLLDETEPEQFQERLSRYQQYMDWLHRSGLDVPSEIIDRSFGLVDEAVEAAGKKTPQGQMSFGAARGQWGWAESSLVRIWARSDPRAALSYVRSMDDPQSRLASYSQLIGGMMQQ